MFFKLFTFFRQLLVLFSVSYTHLDVYKRQLQGSNGTVNIKETTNGDYFYRDENGVGYTDNGDGTWTDENGNTYTE